MLPSLGFGETLLILLIAIVVVGPKDLPKLARAVGGFMAKVKALGNEFRQAFEEMGAEEEIAELRREIEDLKKMGPEDKDFLREMNQLNTELREGTDLTK